MPVLAVAAFARWQEAQACFEEHGFELAYFGRHGCIVDFLEGKVEQKIVQKTRKKQNVFNGKDEPEMMYHGPCEMYHGPCTDGPFEMYHVPMYHVPCRKLARWRAKLRSFS